MEARLVHTQKVAGSNPVPATICNFMTTRKRYMLQVTADQKKAFKREFMRLAKKWHMTEWAVEFIFDCDMEPQARIQHDWELSPRTINPQYHLMILLTIGHDIRSISNV